MTTLLLLGLLLGADGATLVHRQDAARYAIAADKGLQAGAKVPEHTQEASETLVVLEGSCTLTLGSGPVVLVAGDTVHLPRGEKHAAEVPADAKGPFVAIQVYAPAGPEQRFTKGKKL